MTIISNMTLNMALYDIIQGAVAQTDNSVVIKEEGTAYDEGERDTSPEPTPPPPPPSVAPTAEPPLVWDLPKIAPLPDLTSYIVAAPQPIGALEMCGVFAAGVVIGFIFCKVLTPTSESCDWGSSSDC
jgi:hypothetical protein